MLYPLTHRSSLGRFKEKHISNDTPSGKAETKGELEVFFLGINRGLTSLQTLEIAVFHLLGKMQEASWGGLA